MVPVSYIVIAIVSAAFGSVTTIFMLSITTAAKKADEEEDKLFCEYLKGKKNGIMKRQRSKNGRCLLCNITKTDQIHDTDRDLCDDNMYKKEENYFSAICFNRRIISSF